VACHRFRVSQYLYVEIYDLPRKPAWNSRLTTFRSTHLVFVGLMALIALLVMDFRFRKRGHEASKARAIMIPIVWFTIIAVGMAAFVLLLNLVRCGAKRTMVPHPAATSLGTLRSLFVARLAVVAGRVVGFLIWDCGARDMPTDYAGLLCIPSRLDRRDSQVAFLFCAHIRQESDRIFR
jgi:hypothetical protein